MNFTIEPKPKTEALPTDTLIFSIFTTLTSKNGIISFIASNYNFLIQYHVKSEVFYKEIEIAFYDKTYFVQVLLKNEIPVTFRDTNNIDFTYEIFDDEKNAYYYGQIFPETILLKFKGKEWDQGS